MMFLLVLLCVLVGITAEDRIPNYGATGRKFDSAYNDVLESIYNDSVDSTKLLEELHQLYRDDSTIVFDTAELKGRTPLLRKLKSLKVHGRATRPIDILAGNDGSIVMLAVGQIKLDKDVQKPFTQMFILKQDSEKQWFCSEEIFRFT